MNSTWGLSLWTLDMNTHKTDMKVNLNRYRDRVSILGLKVNEVMDRTVKERHPKPFQQPQIMKKYREEEEKEDLC